MTIEEKAIERYPEVYYGGNSTNLQNAYIEGANYIINDFLENGPKANFSSFIEYLDNNRPKGKMCLSNGECSQLDNAFKNGDWDIILKYAKKYNVI